MYNLYTAHQQAQEHAHLRRKKGQFKKIAPFLKNDKPHDDTALQQVVDAVLQDTHDGSSPLPPQRKQRSLHGNNNNNNNVLRRDSYSTFTTAAETPENIIPAIVAQSGSGLLPLLIAIPTIIESPDEDARQDHEDRPNNFPSTFLGDFLFSDEIEEEEIIFVPDDLASTETAGTSSTVQPPYPRWAATPSSVSTTNRTRKTMRKHTTSSTTSSCTSTNSKSNKSTAAANSAPPPTTTTAASRSRIIISRGSNSRRKAASTNNVPQHTTTTRPAPTPTRSLLRRLPSVGLEMLQPPTRNFTPPKKLYYPAAGAARTNIVMRSKKKNWSPSSSFRMSRLEI
jgi:hypothetical protein